ncbi:MAG: hypothetical protein IJ661_06245 [Lachnospiraceae bacterium]|nr:hypothetical protein [Lachnospiraceae bacterium]
MAKDGQTDTEKKLEEQLKYEENMKSTIRKEATGAVMSFASVISEEIINNAITDSQLYKEIIGQESVDDDMEPLLNRALEDITKKDSNAYDVMGNAIYVNVIKDRDAFNKYKGKMNQMADKLDELLDNNVANDEYGEKSKEYIRSISSGQLRRIASGRSDTYLSYKNILAGGMSSLYAVLNASTADDRLQKNIEKWEHKFPIHQLVIDGEKQLKTMSDYWMEKEQQGGALTPEKEQEYRQKLYDQTVNMSVLYDKMISGCESKQVNDEIKADQMLGNAAFHLHPMSNRGTTSLKTGLHAMKIGLENGWHIEDIGRLAAFYNLMYREQNRAICNGDIDLEKFEKYDKPQYQNNEHEAYVHRLETAWKKVEKTKLESADARKKILEELDGLVKEGIKNNELESADARKEIREERDQLVQDGSYLSNNKGAVYYYYQTMSQGVIRDHMIETGKEPAFYDRAHNIKMGQERRFDTIFSNMNAAKLGSESTEHKNMRTAAEELQTFLKENPKKDITKEKLADYSAKYLEKLEAVKKTTDVYKESRRGASTEAGKIRFQGAEEASLLAGIEIDNVMQELKANGLANEKDSMEVYRIKDLAKRVGYKEAIREQAKNLDELVNDLKKVDKWTSSPNFKNLKNGLNELKEFSDKINKSSKPLTTNDLDKYNELVDKVGKLADTYLENKKDINSDYARSRVNAVKKVKAGINTFGEAFKDASKEFKKEIEQKIFGDKYKLYDQMKITFGDGAAVFWGEKYKDPKTRSNGHGGYNVTRTAGISVSVFALANTGKYSFEDIMDPAKLHDEKQAMFDKVVTAMQHPTPESQKWIAETIYEGQKTTENMINEQAKQVDFSKADIRNDKRFCQMLNMSHLQFDAWQEMARCQNEIMELARKDHPEMKEYNDYKEWWAGRQGILGSLYTAIDNKRDNIVDSVSRDYFLNSGKIVQSALTEKNVMDDLANMQKEKKDIPFSEWVTPEKNQEYFLSSNMAFMSVKKQVDYMVKNPEDTLALYAKFTDGSILKNTSISVDMSKAEVTVSGFPSIDELKKIAETERFLEKTDAALGRLENGKYKNKESFIEDSAYAMIGQMYRVNGGKLPDKKDGSSMSLEEYKNMQVQSKAFVDSLKSPDDPKKFISPKKVAATAKNNDKLHDMARNNTVKKEAQVRTRTTVNKKEKSGPAK